MRHACSNISLAESDHFACNTGLANGTRFCGLVSRLSMLRNAAIARFHADGLMRSRQTAVVPIMDGMALELVGFPVTVDRPQIENLPLPNAESQGRARSPRT